MASEKAQLLCCKEEKSRYFIEPFRSYLYGSAIYKARVEARLEQQAAQALVQEIVAKEERPDQRIYLHMKKVLEKDLLFRIKKRSRSDIQASSSIDHLFSHYRLKKAKNTTAIGLLIVQRLPVSKKFNFSLNMHDK